MFWTIFFAVALWILAAWFIINAKKDDWKMLGNILLCLVWIALVIWFLGLLRWGAESLEWVTIDAPDRLGWVFVVFIILLFPLLYWLSIVKEKWWLKKRWAYYKSQKEQEKKAKKQVTKEEKRKKSKKTILWCLKYIGIIIWGAVLIVWLVILIIYLVSKS